MSDLNILIVINVTLSTSTQAFKARERKGRERERERETETERERERQKPGERDRNREKQIKRKNPEGNECGNSNKKKDEERQTNVIDYRQLKKLRPCLFNHDKNVQSEYKCYIPLFSVHL